jgi:glycosyltransferase involved in cell wall biosynthesis
LFFCYALRIKHRIYFNHGIPYVAYTFLIRFLLKTIEVSNLFFCTQALTVSDQSKEILNSLKSCKQVSLIGNGSACGIDLNRIDYLRINSSRNWRINNDFKPDDFLVAFIGRAEARKGFKKIIEMWTNFKFEKNFYLIICGPSYRDVERFGLVSNENMRVYGYVEDIFEILNEVDVVVLPSFHEGLPYVLLEAMAFGCVVIGNNTFGINALIRDGYNGYLVDNNNIQLFFEKIMYVYNHKSEMLNIKNNASSYIRQYDREIFFHSYRVFIGNLR